MDTISELLNKPIELSNYFATEESTSSSGSSNIVSIKCTKALFSKDALKNNISINYSFYEMWISFIS